METQFHLTAALATVLLLATAAVSATVQFSQFQDAGLDDRRFVDNVLFVDSSVRSRLDCAVSCASSHGCVTFTYSGQGSLGRGSCRGHSTNMESGSPQDKDDGTKTYSRSSSPTLDPSELCATGSHMVLDDYRRDVNYAQNDYLCDYNTLEPGWYRFFIEGSSAVMPTHCPPEDHCGAVAPMWLDLQSATLPAPGQDLQARACASHTGDCCYSGWDVPVTVRNCGSFYIYRLQPPVACVLRYCAEHVDG